jgi:hypothetical protein
MDWRLLLRGAASVNVVSRRTLILGEQEAQAEMRARALREGIADSVALERVQRERLTGQCIFVLFAQLILAVTVAEYAADCPAWLMVATAILAPCAWVALQLGVRLLPTLQPA